MNKKSIRIEADIETYSILEREQVKYREMTNRKISLADIILHYFSEGYSNANEETKQGLSIVVKQQLLNGVETEVKTVEIKEEINKKLMDSVLTILENREEGLDNKERWLFQRENELYKTLSEQKINSFSNTELMMTQKEIISLLNDVLKRDNRYEDLRKNQEDQVSSRDINKLKKSLYIIESQTRKSVLNQLLPFVTPIMLLVGGFLLNKKLDSKRSKGDLIDEIKELYTSLDDDAKKIVTENFEKVVTNIINE